MTLARELVLLRHGRTTWNHIDRAQGHTDVPLDETGHEQAEAAAGVLAGLTPARLWTSDLARARETAAHLEQRTGLVAVLDPRLREFDLGVRSGLTRAEFADRYPQAHAAWLAGTHDPLVPGEESVVAVRDRMGAALGGHLEELAPGETGVVVGHGASIKVGLFALIGWPWEAARGLRVLENGAWAVVVADDEHAQPRLAAYNLLPRRRAAVDFASDEGVG